MKLSKYEKETIINFNDAEPTASVYTHNRKLKSRLAGFAGQFPEQIKLESEDKTGSVTYSVPKALITVRKPYSEERRAADRQRVNMARFGAKSTDKGTLFGNEKGEPDN